MNQNNLWLLPAALVIINIFSFISVGLDKKRSVDQARRLPEVFLFFISIFFASPGVFVGIFLFRHKTKKLYFPVGIGLLLIEQTFLVIFIINSLKGG
jgi:uncharacterized membrane protein YsdA (DUF1294 family)